MSSEGLDPSSALVIGIIVNCIIVVRINDSPEKVRVARKNQTEILIGKIILACGDFCDLLDQQFIGKFIDMDTLEISLAGRRSYRLVHVIIAVEN